MKLLQPIKKLHRIYWYHSIVVIAVLGRAMPVKDSLIAATALEYGLPLVTRNKDDFEHIEGLQIINPFDAE